MEKIVSLYRHWVTADSIKESISFKFDTHGKAPAELEELANLHSANSRLSVFYGLIYVVIEGYKELKYQDPKIDSLLNNEEFVDALRLFRNSTFHYQKKLVPEKILKFLELHESEKWIKDLHHSFETFFEETLHIGEIINNFKV